MELTLQRVTMVRVAREVFGAKRWFVEDRCSGRTPFGAWELVQVADYLHVDVCQFLNAAKQGTPDDGAPPPTGLRFHDGRASYDSPAPVVAFTTPAARLAA